MSSKNKRILITAGPTWVAIDSVRVISNIASGETGILLAREAARQGFKVTLFLGPAQDYFPKYSTKIVRFKFYDELRAKLKKELSVTPYDYIIHSAAVSDFAPARTFKGKIASGEGVTLRLRPLSKITSDIKRAAPKAKLVIFKLEVGVSDRELIKRARTTQKKAGAELVIANKFNPYKAFIIDKKGSILSVKSKIELIKRLLKIISQ